jgi:release factor glutamine methyltransferase
VPITGVCQALHVAPAPVTPRGGDRAAVAARLRAAGCVYADDEAAVLLASADTPDELERMVRERESGLPLEHVVGWAEFCGLRIAVRAGVFVPRRRSELLVRRAVAAAPSTRVLVDLCCGSGAIARVLAERLQPHETHATDIDPVALRCARRNLDPVGGQVHEGDLYDGLPARLRGHVDLLVANAPYVPTGELPLMPAEARLHEPRSALDGGADGVDLHRRIAEGAPAWLAAGGHLLIETSERQAPRTASLLDEQGFAVRVVRDEERDGTCVVGVLGGR